MFKYERREPEHTLLYKVVKEYYPRYLSHLADEGRELPHKPMRQWVLSVPFPLRFLFASQPQVMNKVICIIHRVISTYLIKKAGYNKKTARTGAVTFI